MTDAATSPPNPHPNRTCDFCGSATRAAVLYCRADSANLCLSCDLEVHVTNPLFAKHSRSLLCDACDSSPSSIHCPAESLSLCHNCDWAHHSHGEQSLHERRPVEGFCGTPSVDELIGLFGFEGLGKKELFDADDVAPEEFGDYLVWDTPPIVTMDDLILSNSGVGSLRAMGVPPFPKNRKAACGKYKEEILKQLREIAKIEPNLNDDHKDNESTMQLQFQVPQQELYPRDIYTGFGNCMELPNMPPSKDSSFWSSDSIEFANQCYSGNLFESSFEDSCLVPDKDLDVGGNASHANCDHEELSVVHHAVHEKAKVFPKFIPRELTSQERDSAISRYREKKRNRRYDKHIRYESRRLRAENRTRIKGRFAKIEHQDADMH